MLKKSFLPVMLLTLTASTMYAQFPANDADAKYATELLKPGVTAPDFKLKDIAGKTQKLSKLIKGKYTVIDFWASWCPDCRKDIPNLRRMYDRFHGKGVEFVGVSFDDNLTAWQDAVQKYQIPYTQVS